MSEQQQLFKNGGDGTVHFNKKEAEYICKRLLHLAEQKVNRTKCQCGNKKRKVVPLFEFGDPFIPSQVILFCPECKRNEVFAERPNEEALQYAELKSNKNYNGEKKEIQNKKAEQLINEAITLAGMPLKKIEKSDIMKDEDNKIIADKETVKNVDSKKK